MHVVPKADDYTLQFIKPCKLYDELYDKQILPKINDGLFVKYAPLMQYLKKYSGANLRTLTDFNHLYDNLNIEKSMGLEYVFILFISEYRNCFETIIFD